MIHIQRAIARIGRRLRRTTTTCSTSSVLDDVRGRRPRSFVVTRHTSSSNARASSIVDVRGDVRGDVIGEVTRRIVVVERRAWKRVNALKRDIEEDIERIGGRGLVWIVRVKSERTREKAKTTTKGGGQGVRNTKHHAINSRATKEETKTKCESTHRTNVGRGGENDNDGERGRGWANDDARCRARSSERTGHTGRCGDE